jgi:hypothetical protein
MNQNKKIQIANIERANAGIDDDVWRGEILPRFGATPDADGRVSLKSVPASRLDSLIAELRRKSGRQSQDWRAARIKKIKTVWRLLFEAGVVRNSDESALRRWCRTVAGVDKLEWATAKKLDTIIEAQKKWAMRCGFDIEYECGERKTFLFKLGDGHG